MLFPKEQRQNQAFWYFCCRRSHLWWKLLKGIDAKWLSADVSIYRLTLVKHDARRFWNCQQLFKSVIHFRHSANHSSRNYHRKRQGNFRKCSYFEWYAFLCRKRTRKILRLNDWHRSLYFTFLLLLPKFIKVFITFLFPYWQQVTEIGQLVDKEELREGVNDDTENNVTV